MVETKNARTLRVTSYVRDSKEDALYGPFHKWLKVIRAEATMQENAYRAPKQIGEVTAIIVDRAAIRNSFHSSMEEPHDETLELALTLFDRYGRLRREIIEHSERKGSGVWGEELNKGNFVLITDTMVQENWRRRGVGSKLILHILNKAMASKESPSFAFAYPGITDDDRGDRPKTREAKAQYIAVRRSKMDVITSFFRSLKFRRVGLTGWFALARDKTHLSHQLVGNEDANPVRDDLSDSDSDDDIVIISNPSVEKNGTCTFDQKRMTQAEAAQEGNYAFMYRSDGKTKREDPRSTTAILKRLHPLHRAIQVLEDKACLDFLQSRAEIDSDNGLNITATNGRGETILHVAARSLKPQSLSWILESSKGTELACVRDHSGYTPLEALQAQLESERIRKPYSLQRAELMADKFEGYNTAAIACFFKMMGIEEPTAKQRDQARFGCSCGLCVAGFLSPRMIMKLQKAAETLYKAFTDSTHSQTDGQSWFLRFKQHLTYLPKDLRLKFPRNVILRKTFTELTGVVSKCLSESIVPYRQPAANIAMTTSAGAQIELHYFRKGGSVAAIMNEVVDLAKRHAIQMERSMDLLGLPNCRNDLEFEFVRRHAIDDSPPKKEVKSSHPVGMQWMEPLLNAQALDRNPFVNAERLW